MFGIQTTWNKTNATTPESPIQQQYPTCRIHVEVVLSIPCFLFSLNYEITIAAKPTRQTNATDPITDLTYQRSVPVAIPLVWQPDHRLHPNPKLRLTARCLVLRSALRLSSRLVNNHRPPPPIFTSPVLPRPLLPTISCSEPATSN